jgi:hypothetical protein
MERARIRRLKKIFWRALVAVLILLVIAALGCFHIEKRLLSTYKVPQIWPPAAQLEDIIIRTTEDRLKVSPSVTLHIEQLMKYPQTARVLLKVKCLFGVAVFSYPGTCRDMYIEQIEGYGVTHTRRISLHDQQEKDWIIQLNGNQFYYPFDHYMAVGHMGGIMIFFPEGELLEFNSDVSTYWNPRDGNLSDPSLNLADIKSTITIYFSRPLCLWILGLLWLGGISILSIFGVWLYRGSFQEYIALLGFPLVSITLRADFLAHVPPPTIFDMVGVAVFVVSLLIIVFASPEHRRIRAR